MANNIKKMLGASEIGAAKAKVKGKAKKGNMVGKQLKAKKNRFSTAQI